MPLGQTSVADPDFDIYHLNSHPAVDPIILKKTCHVMFV